MSVAPAPLASELSVWLEANAGSLDAGAALAAEVLPRLAAGGVLGAGVAEELGGNGGDVTDGVETIAAVSERSLAAGFVFWGHRCYIEYLLQSPNAALRERLFPDLLAGRVAGATGLSNAMKFLTGLEELHVSARPRSDGFPSRRQTSLGQQSAATGLPCCRRSGPRGTGRIHCLAGA
jgi:alkylation response protein AidB-like acyl-CoA dehydrogenase